MVTDDPTFFGVFSKKLFSHHGVNEIAALSKENKVPIHSFDRMDNVLDIYIGLVVCKFYLSKHRSACATVSAALLQTCYYE